MVICSFFLFSGCQINSTGFDFENDLSARVIDLNNINSNNEVYENSTIPFEIKRIFISEHYSPVKNSRFNSPLKTFNIEISADKKYFPEFANSDGPIMTALFLFIEKYGFKSITYSDETDEKITFDFNITWNEIKDYLNKDRSMFLVKNPEFYSKSDSVIFLAFCENCNIKKLNIPDEHIMNFSPDLIIDNTNIITDGRISYSSGESVEISNIKVVISGGDQYVETFTDGMTGRFSINNEKGIKLKENVEYKAEIFIEDKEIITRSFTLESINRPTINLIIEP